MICKKKFFFISLIIILMSCNTTNERKDILKTVSGNSKDYSLQYEVIYGKKDLTFNLTSFFNKQKEVSSETLIKKNDGYYSRNSYPNGLNNNEDNNLILSINKDTSYFYKSAGNTNSYEIKKIDKLLFKSTTELTGMSSFKQIIFFDKNYNILKIERYLGNKKYVFKSDKY